MARYTFHWVFENSGKTYHIYGSSKEERGYNFGSKYELPGGNIVRLNLLDTKGTKIDHGGDILEWQKNIKYFKAAAGEVVDSCANIPSPVGIVINCNQGRMRTSLVAILVYCKIMDVAASAGLQSYHLAKFSSKEIRLSEDQLGYLDNILKFWINGLGQGLKCPHGFMSVVPGKGVGNSFQAITGLFKLSLMPFRDPSPVP